MDTIEKRARELLVTEYKDRGELVHAFNIERGGLSCMYAAEIAAIAKALTPPEGYVLVPVEAPAKEMWTLICGPSLAGIDRTDSDTPDADRHGHFGWFLLAWPELLGMLAARPEVS